MEKKTITSISLLVIISFVAGLLLGGITMRPVPTTTTVTQVSTVAATTVEIPIRYQLGASYAIAHTTCILYGSPQQGEHDPEKCEGGGHTKAVEINIVLRGLGTENVYIIPQNVRVIAPGLYPDAAAKGSPRDGMGRVVARSTGSANMWILTEVINQTNFYQHISQGGKIAVAIPFLRQDGGYVDTLVINDIDLVQAGWKLPTNSTEMGQND
jgi:hypothetical protein